MYIMSNLTISHDCVVIAIYLAARLKLWYWNLNISNFSSYIDQRYL